MLGDATVLRGEGKVALHGGRLRVAVGLATDLQLASALPKTDLVEYKTGSPYIDEVAAGGWELDEDGALTIPEGPGLGLELDPEAVARYSGGRNPFDE